MPHIPKCFCLDCMLEMVPYRNGQVLEVRLSTDEPYYKIMSDTYQCVNCFKVVGTGMAVEPMVEHFQPEYDQIHSQYQVFLRR